jgi:hypothetical protein
MGADGPVNPPLIFGGPQRSGGPERTGFLQRSGREEHAEGGRGKNLAATVS